MTQTLIALALIALWWGGPVAAVWLACCLWKRSKIRYHVGCTRSRVPVQTFRTRSAARKASMRLYRAHGRAFRITRTR